MRAARRLPASLTAELLVACMRNCTVLQRLVLPASAWLVPALLSTSLFVSRRACLQEERMQKAVSVVADNFNTMRTGRANPAILDRIQVRHQHNSSSSGSSNSGSSSTSPVSVSVTLACSRQRRAVGSTARNLV